MVGDLGARQGAIDLAIEHIDHIVRRTRAHHDPEEPYPFVFRHAHLGDGRNLGQHRHARASGHRQRAQLAGAHMLQRARDVGGQHVDVVAQQPDQRGPEAAERDVRHLDAGLLGELLDGEMGKRAVSGGAVVHFAGPRLGVHDKLRQRVHRQRRMHHNHRRNRHQQRDRLEVALGVVRRLVAERGIGGDVGAGLQQRVAVGGCLRDRGRPDDRGGAGLVLHDDGLSKILRELVGHEPRDRVRVTARRERHDHVDLPRRIGLARGHVGLEQHDACEKKCEQNLRHSSSGW